MLRPLSEFPLASSANERFPSRGIPIRILRQHFMKKIILSMVAILGGLGALRAEDAVKPYPLTTCIISGEKLGGMGEPFTFVYEGQEVKLCCHGCKDEFDKHAAENLKQIQAAKPGA